MSTEEDNFDIDIYGEESAHGQGGGDEYYDEDDHTFTVDEPEPESKAPPFKTETTPVDGMHSEETKPPQGVKRKTPSDERHIDSDATTALMVSDLHWWTTEDELRAWANQVNAETELREISFSEHKVNGKSKGQAYLLFQSAQSATAVKHKVESLTDGAGQARKFSVIFTGPSSNPFKTMPKDAPARNKEERPSRGAYNSGYSRGDYSDRGSFRGRGRGYDRGGYNRNFSGSSSGPGYNNNAYGNNMGMMNNFGFNNRGNMMGGNMRGGNMAMRGGRGGNMANMMPMGPMGAMPNLANPMMMAGMGMQGFQGNQFGPGMFGAGFGGDWGQPGAKRQRQE
ncbi:uncharacterized protein HMPREF1541_09415 [Cyphellophora europaea CBS 101466]|uniref:RRM domain-containing protein n=1 Tax=Cyphellophora europaea (strain CBS 101466) TaxID=1220924 RepID=W2SC39_CYPE1|nr:uncharacterized protein HMPREF1541_09415 [Cyphellophora europaea CBS 101466]ETN45583.1 hypothetical protein HMPREF1541_09415 [Cyphellophora europaea CBS 101466]